MKQLHDTTKKLAGKYGKPERPVKDKEGKPITEIQQQQKRWVECFEELLNRPAPMNSPDIEAANTDLPIDVNPPTKEEIRTAVRQIKNGKAAGPDNIPAEALKSDIELKLQTCFTFYSKRFWRRNKCRWTEKKGYKHALPYIQKDLGGGTSGDGLERRAPRQDSKERRSDQM
ncbi:unnamed protein product [Schistosoma margrebowiei]|uniref:Uncharacterized protein n=1 Tax=Schistosoma margrebowiei TaxID=48269 RepID=A0A183MD23_9TREM|nr:unnamed protein product [Schistosoma margrebowiei]